MVNFDQKWLKLTKNGQFCLKIGRQGSLGLWRPRSEGSDTVEGPGLSGPGPRWPRGSEFPEDFPEFPRNFPEISGKFPGFPEKSGEFPRKIREISTNFPEILPEFPGNFSEIPRSKGGSGTGWAAEGGPEGPWRTYAAVRPVPGRIRRPEWPPTVLRTWNFPGNSGQFLRNFPESPPEFPGNFRKVRRNFPGNFRNFPEKFLRISGKFPRNFPGPRDPDRVAWPEGPR